MAVGRRDRHLRRGDDRRRAPQLPGTFSIGLAANATTAAVALGLTFGLGIFPLDGRTIVPIAGMVVGNSFKSCVVIVQLLAEQAADRRDEIEARLALGLHGRRGDPPARAPVAAARRSRRRSRTSRRSGSCSCPAR